MAAVAYGLTLAGLVLGLLVSDAPLKKYVSAPLTALVVAVLTAVGWAFLMLIFPHFTAGLGMRGTLLARVTVLLAAGTFAGLWRPNRQANHAVTRGTRITDLADRSRATGPAQRGVVTLAGQAVPALDEVKHFKIIGTTGTGKSTAIRELLRGALARGDRAVVADPGGVYVDEYYDAGRGDLILNPFDPRSNSWDLFGELRKSFDGDLIARALIPEQGGSDRAWRTYARVLLSCLIRQLASAGCRDISTLHRLIISAPVEELRILLESTAAAPYLTDENARFFGSVRAIASSQVAALEHLGASPDLQPLSIRQWVRNGQGTSTRGVLFLPYRASEIATLSPIISAWLRIAIFEAMALDGPESRLWFIVDELDALGAIDGLKDALARLRKFGGRCVLGIQSIAQVSGTYGVADGQTIVENCGNSLILRCSAGENGGTARFASRLIGEREIVRQQVTRSVSGFFEKPHRSKNVSQQYLTESAVLPAEIEQLPDLCGYLKFASAAAWLKVRVPIPS